MKRYILTGTPGCGKTSLIRSLEMKEYFVVEEAATDVIAYEQSLGNREPWRHPNFINQILHLQKYRQKREDLPPDSFQFYDRSPICTYALSIYLGFEPSVLLTEEIECLTKNEFYQKEVLFIQNLGFCEETSARKISFEESLIFEEIHNDMYKKFGYTCIKIPTAPLNDRTNLILKTIFKKEFSELSLKSS